jgi:2-polyprenyl-3-methyl-5-hydroxy-6-metoxy-1,4-benzoquinol methylase
LIARGEKFDAISIIEVIEHLPYNTVEQLLEQMSQLLNPSGCVVLTTPNYRSLWPLIELVVNAFSRVSYEDQHINKYTPGKLQRQMSTLFDAQVSTIVGLAPFLAAISDKFVSPANELGASCRHFGLGNLILATGRLKSTVSLH